MQSLSLSEDTTFGIVGYGQFGQFIHLLIKKVWGTSSRVLIYDVDQVKNTSDLSVVAAADMVFVCVSLSQYVEMIQVISKYVLPHTVVFDIATVKECTAKACAEYFKNNPYVSCHPMFGPASYYKNDESLKGFRVAVIEHTVSDNVFKKAVHFLEECGLVVVSMEPATHDIYLAETLFITHYIGQIVSKAGFVRTEIDTASFGYLMDAVDSVKNDEQLFRDVYVLNPHCKQVVEKMKQVSERLFLNI